MEDNIYQIILNDTYELTGSMGGGNGILDHNLMFMTIPSYKVPKCTVGDNRGGITNLFKLEKV